MPHQVAITFTPRHYRNLIIFPKHLPFNEKKNCLDTKIEWTESMSFSKRLSSYSIEYERISVLYNLTACYNNLVSPPLSPTRASPILDLTRRPQASTSPPAPGSSANSSEYAPPPSHPGMQSY